MVKNAGEDRYIKPVWCKGKASVFSSPQRGGVLSRVNISRPSADYCREYRVINDAYEGEKC